MVFHPFSFKIGRILVAPHHLPLFFGWAIVYSYNWLSHTLLWSFIGLFLLFRVYVPSAATGLHQSYHSHSFVKCCYMFCSVYMMFKGADIISLSAHLMFLVVVFMYYWGFFFLFSYLNTSNSFDKYDLKWYFIIRSNKSWISVQITLNLVCNPIPYFIFHFITNCL